MAILAVNAGSSSLKFSLHPYEGGQVLPHTVSGNFEGLEPGGQPILGWKHQGKKHKETIVVPADGAPFQVALARLRSLVQELDLTEITLRKRLDVARRAAAKQAAKRESS